MFVSELFSGIFSYLRALRLISQLKLWRYVLLPGLISFVLAVLIFSSVFAFSDNIGDWATAWYRAEKGEAIVSTLGAILSGAILFIISLLLFKHIVLAVVAPFMSPLSERIEAHYRGELAPKPFKVEEFASDILRSLRLSLRNISWEILMTLVLLFLGLIIPFLSPFTTALIFLIQAYYAGFGNMDFTLERHFDFKGRVQFVKQHRGLAIGNGIVFIGLLLTVLGFLIVIPLATAASTMEVMKILERDKINMN